MFENSIFLLDWLGIVVFTISGALVASRNQMDLVGFILLGTVTGIGGGTIRDLLLDAHPILWLARPQYLAVCILVSVAVFFTAHLVASRYRVILWFDAAGLALFAIAGAEKAVALGQAPLVAVTMGVISACFGGIIRDVLGKEDSIIFSREIYVTAAVLAATTYVVLDALGVFRELAIGLALMAGFGLRAGALAFGWSLPRYKSRAPYK
ncbi:MAG: trimeric intracellular cation channel family protein [Hyphomicrobiales bacterium]|nr:MAG: trimeric intracellular cation channel family protein [Hyphomicrobiales bacterium]